MIRQVDFFEFGPLSSSPPFRAPAHLIPTAAHIDPSTPTNRSEEIEQEITRLTWSVLDGSASLSDRQRLAKLVNDQHALRRR